MPNVENIDELTRRTPHPESIDPHPAPTKPGIMPPGRIKSLRDNSPVSEASSRRTESRFGFASRIRVSAALAKVVSDLESRMVTVLTTQADVEARQEAQLELAMLAELRAGLVTTSAPEDVSVLEALAEASDRAQEALRDLQGEESVRLGQLARYVRQVLGQARALGCAPTTATKRWQELKRRIDGDVAQEGTIMADLVTLHTQLRSAMAASDAGGDLSLLDTFLG